VFSKLTIQSTEVKETEKEGRSKRFIAIQREREKAFSIYLLIHIDMEFHQLVIANRKDSGKRKSNGIHFTQQEVVMAYSRNLY
jgi:hypothetical protein